MSKVLLTAIKFFTKPFLFFLTKNEIIKKVDNEENSRVYYILTRKGRYFWKRYVLSKNILTKEEVDKRDELPF